MIQTTAEEDLAAEVQKDMAASGTMICLLYTSMELVAAREAMAAFIRKRAPDQGLRLHTDSRNVIGWLRENWKRKANVDLFPELDRLTSLLGESLAWVWVHGHQDNPGNNRVDELAVAACQRVKPNSRSD